VEFRLLGPLDVRAGGRPVAVRGLRLSAVLATLLLNANRSVTVPELGRAAWSEPPRSIGSNVRTYIAQLRALFADAGEPKQRVLTDPTGYRLVVHEGELDLATFDELLAAGEAALVRAEPLVAMRKLEDAVKLCRGDPLTGLTAGPLLLGAAARLDERRVLAVERWADAALAAGRPEVVVAELTQRVRVWSLRENLWASLMLALYRCGRPGDALAVYQQAYRLFREELGTLPGQAMQRLQQRILAGDPGLDPSPGSGHAGFWQTGAELRPVAAGSGQIPAGELPKPRQLPANVTSFSGRDCELHELDALLAGVGAESQPSVAVVTGPPGIGKTALAMFWAHRSVDRFPDGQLYADLRGFSSGPPVRPGDALAGFLRALGIAPVRIPTDPEQAAGLYRSVLADRRMLVLLDNAASADQVRPLLPGSPGSAVVITSRDGLAGLRAREGARQLRLGALNQAASVALVTRLVGAAGMTAQPEAVMQLARLCGGLPLALRICAAILTSQPQPDIGAFVAELARNRLAALGVAGDPRNSVRAAFDVSYRRLATPARHLFQLIGLIDGPDFDAVAAARLLDSTDPEAAAILDTLTRAHLIERHRPGRYRTHDLLRRFARDQARVECTIAERTAALDRLLRWYLRLTCDAHDAVYGTGKTRRSAQANQALAWFADERPNLLAAALQAAADPALRGPAAELIVAMSELVRGDGNATAWQTVAVQVLSGLRTAGDRRLVADIQTKRCRYLSDSGDHAAAAHCQMEAVSLYRALGDHAAEARARLNLAVVRHLQGQHQQAAIAYAAALQAARAGHDRKLEAYARLNLSAVNREMRRYPRAVEHARVGRAILRELGDWHGEATALDELAVAYKESGDACAAVEALRAGVELVRGRDRVVEGRIWRALGESLLAMGDPAAARTALDHAVRLLTRAGCLDSAAAARALAAATA
jgi:DNA-binding SARP family transcriptional activator